MVPIAAAFARSTVLRLTAATWITIISFAPFSFAAEPDSSAVEKLMLESGLNDLIESTVAGLRADLAQMATSLPPLESNVRAHATLEQLERGIAVALSPEAVSAQIKAEIQSKLSLSDIEKALAFFRSAPGRNLATTQRSLWSPEDFRRIRESVPAKQPSVDHERVTKLLNVFQGMYSYPIGLSLMTCGMSGLMAATLPTFPGPTPGSSQFDATVEEALGDSDRELMHRATTEPDRTAFINAPLFVVVSSHFVQITNDDLDLIVEFTRSKEGHAFFSASIREIARLSLAGCARVGYGLRTLSSKGMP